jgi:hypothetical protein
LIAYQRNIGLPLPAQQDVLDEATEDLVGEEQVRARDQAGDQDDDGALDQLLLAGPVDLLQLAPRLLDEVPEAAARNVTAAVRARGLGSRPQLLLLLARPRALGRGLALELRSATRASLGTGLSRHYLVSRWGVCLPHQRQYLLNSTRSGVFRFDFIVW